MNDIEKLEKIIFCYTNNPMTNYNKEICKLAEEKIATIREKAEREKGCDWCKSDKGGLRFSKNFYFPNRNKAGNLAIGENELLITFFQKLDPGLFSEYKMAKSLKINFCPMCGRDLRKEDDK